ncbi:MAG: hypothetical protein IJF74_00340, partial [Clostridia bacterium]|nr:hypothetical protein [Clostridia bacterium]
NVPAVDHKFGDWTPNNDGKTHSRVCSCNESETADHRFDEGEVTQAPTHEAVGEKKYTCSDCGYFYMEEVPALTDHEWGDWVINKQDEANTHIRFCICNESQTAPHTFDNGEVTVPATHTSKGEMTFTCTDGCGYYYTEEIPATPDHEWTNWSPNGDGTHTRACRCNANETKDCEWDNGVVTQAPTHYEEGVRTYTCPDCGNTRTESIAKTDGHTWSDWAAMNDGANHIRECKCGATETAEHNWGEWGMSDEGLYGHRCADCGAFEAMNFDAETPVNTTDNNNAANTNLTNSDLELVEKLLTDDERSEAAKGAQVKVYLKVEDISAAAPAAHVAEAEEKAGDDTIGMYLDIDLFKQIGNSDEKQVTETSGTVSITITIPENLINTDPSVVRSYKIIRVHEDENGNLITDVIEGVFDPETNSFTFETDKFSTYALAYNDEVSEDYVPISPSTGDGTLIFCAAALISGAMMLTFAMETKKRRAMADN